MRIKRSIQGVQNRSTKRSAPPVSIGGSNFLRLDDFGCDPQKRGVTYPTAHPRGADSSFKEARGDALLTHDPVLRELEQHRGGPAVEIAAGRHVSERLPGILVKIEDRPNPHLDVVLRTSPYLRWRAQCPGNAIQEPDVCP